MSKFPGRILTINKEDSLNESFDETDSFEAH